MQDVLFTMQPLDFINRGAKASIMARGAQKLRSKTSLPLGIERSRIGHIPLPPLLLIRMSSVPPVSSVTLFTAAVMDSEDITSRVRIVTFEALERVEGILEGVRAVAKTW